MTGSSIKAASRVQLIPSIRARFRDIGARIGEVIAIDGQIAIVDFGLRETTRMNMELLEEADG
jgi:hypothetical protein